MRRARSSVGSSAGARPSTRSGSANHGTAEITVSAVTALARGLDRQHAVRGDVNLRGRAGAHRSAARFDVAARRLGVHLVQRLGRQRDRRRPGIGAEHLRQHARKHRRRRLADRLVQRRERERLPQHLAQTRGLAVVHQPALDRLAGRRGQRRARRARARAARSAAARPSAGSTRRSAQPSASQSMTPASRCSGGGSAGHARRDRRPARSIIVTPRFGCRLTCRSAPISRRNANVSV